ncbi:MAG: hypothetical protein ABIU38_08170 [Vicinamibacteraceae bacterium]
MMPALAGGLFIGVLSSLPYIKGGNVCCCLWVISGGALAAWLMQQNTPRPITVGEGAVVGLLSGLVGTVVWIAWGIVGLVLFSSSPFDMADFQRAMTEGGRDVPPEAREALENLSPAVILVVGGVIWSVVSMAFATLGGLLGALIFRRKGGPAAGVPLPPGSGPVGPGFTPPTFTPPAPVPPPFVPPPPSPPPAPPVDFAPPPVNLAPPPVARPIDLPPPSSWPAPPTDDPYVGDAPTMMIPARGLVLPPTPKPAAPPSGAVPPADREPDSH